MVLNRYIIQSVVLCTSPLTPYWSKTYNKFSDEPKLNITDSCGFGSQKSMILLEALGGTKDEQI